jgi:hypothetical protein
MKMKRRIIPIIVALVICFGFATIFASNALTSGQLSNSPNTPNAAAATTVTIAALTAPTVAISANLPATGHVGQPMYGTVLITNPNAFDTNGYVLVITVTGTTVSSGPCSSGTNCPVVTATGPNMYEAQLDECSGSLPSCAAPTSTSVAFYTFLENIPASALGPTPIVIGVTGLVSGTVSMAPSIVYFPLSISYSPASAGTAQGASTIPILNLSK